MNLDVVDLRNFYGEPLGRVVRSLLRDQVRTMWPNVRGDRVMGLGYATPVLRPFHEEAERVIGLMPARMGVVNWPAEGPSATALVHEDELPLSDACMDRVILLHCLEMADQPAQVLREVWRVLAPGGRMIAIVPNRTSVWARWDATPFGTGRPFSRSQLDQLLKDALFSPIDWRGSLHVPPFERRLLIHWAPTLERIGAVLWPAFSGALIVEATKQIYQGLPVRRAEKRFRLPVLVAGPQMRREPTDSPKA
jgi:SAM-dependent methyltransferase